MPMTPPDNNIKTADGLKKLPLHLVPPIGILHEAAVFRYSQERGRAPLNWRDEPVSASIYYDAIGRHLAAWWDGEDNDEGSGLPHLAHAKSNLSILLDAISCGTFNDNRPTPGMSPVFLAAHELVTLPAHPPEPEEVWP